MFEKITNWPFLREPIWRWTVFLIAMGFIMAAWHMVLEYMKD